MERLAHELRVVEIGPSVAAAVVGMVLADHGADVVVVERPGGSRLRSHPAHRMWARGKRCVELDLTAGRGDDGPHPDLGALVADADVVVCAVRPPTAASLGVDGVSLCALNPALVHCSITGFGPGHPLRDVPGYDGVVSSRAGRAWEFGVLHGGQRPAFPAVPVATHGAAMLTLQGMFAALHEREHSGSGQRIETDLLRAASIFDLASWTPGHPMTLRLDDLPVLIYPVCRTADGVWIQFAQNSPSLYRAFLRCLDLSELYDDPRFARAPAVPDPDDARALRAILLDRVAERTWAQWQEVFAGEPDVSTEPFLWPGEVLDHPQAVATGDVTTVHDPALGDSRQLGPLGEFRGAAPGVAATAPTVVPTPVRWQAPGTTEPAGSGPVAGNGAVPPLLAGVTVLELATWIATPLAAAMLAELGARVIKIEPLTGDPMRGHGNVGWKCVQGKESITVDMKTPEGVEIVQRLARGADALVHNFRPGVPERLGIDPVTLHAINPRLVHVYAGSYGSTGPAADRPAFHVTFGAIDGGVIAQIGDEGAPPPGVALSDAERAAWSQILTRANEPNPDFNAALATAAALAMGVWHRDRTGRGQSIETRMLAANAYAMSAHTIDYPGRPARRLPDPHQLGTGARHRLYPTADGWIFLAVPSDPELTRLSRALAIPELPDLDDEALAERLTEVFATAGADEWEALLSAAALGCVRADVGPLPRYAVGADWAEDSGLVVESTSDGYGPYLRYGPAVTGERPVGPMGSADAAGAHTHSLLAELGYDEAAIGHLAATGVVGAAVGAA